jgi:hypothetical protein
MKKWLSDSKNLIIAALLIMCLFLGFCTQCNKTKCPEITSDTITTTVTKYDTVKVTEYVSKPKYVRDTLRITETTPIDSLSVVLAYYTERFYDLVLKDDTSAYIRYCFSVLFNEVEPGRFEFINRRPTYITHTEIINSPVTERKFKLFVGGGVGGSLTSFNVNAGVMVQYRNFLTGANYGFFDKSINIPIYFKLSVKKKRI